MKLAPICLFTYNRLEETKQTIAALQHNYLAKESDLFVFSDGPKNENAASKINDIRAYLKTIEGFKSVTVFESKVNKGLATSIITGITKMFDDFATVIVMEDDLITTPNFLDFMNQALFNFEENKNIYTVNGYSPSIENLPANTSYLHSRSFPWGWATWKDRWDTTFFDKEKIREYVQTHPNVLKDFDLFNGEDASEMLLKTLEGTISSWYIRWVFHNYLLKKKSLFPSLSKVENIGDSESATHYSGGISAYQSTLDTTNTTQFYFNNLTVLPENDYRFLKYFSKKYKLVFRLRMLTSYGGFKKILTEIKTKILK